MARPPSHWDSKGRWFPARVALAYLIAAFTAPLLLALWMMRGTRLMTFGDWAGIVLLYAAFSLAAMVVLGTPLLVLFSRLRWSGFAAFMTGGVACAASTYLVAARGQAQRGQFVLFTAFGVVEGFVLRWILFGLARSPRRSAG